MTIIYDDYWYKLRWKLVIENYNESGGFGHHFSVELIISI